MKIQRRKDIEQFCRDFLTEKKRHLHDVIGNYRHLFTQIDIQQLNLTQETFDSSFKRISRTLFDTRPADRNYIISLLGLRYHCTSITCRIIILGIILRC